MIVVNEGNPYTVRCHPKTVPPPRPPNPFQSRMNDPASSTDYLPIPGEADDLTPPTDAPQRQRGRRSRRKKKSSKWGTMMLIFGGLLLVLILFGWFGIDLYLKSYIKSPAFHEQLNDRLAGTIKAKTEFEDLAWSGNGVQLARLKSTGYADAMFSEATIDDVTAEVKLDLWNRTIEVPLIKLSRVNLRISEDGKLPRPFNPDLDTSAPTPSAGGEESFLDSLKPNKFIFHQMDINELSVRIISQQKEIRLSGLPITMYDKSENQWRNLESHPNHDRAIVMTNLGQGCRIVIRDFKARAHPDQFDLLNFEGELKPLADDKKQTFNDTNPTRIAMTGQYRNEARKSDVQADATINDLKLEEWVEADWVKALKGTADIKATIEGDPAKSETILLQGDFNLKRGVLTGLPMLENLAERTKTKEFTRLELNTAKWNFRKQGEQILLKEIEIEARGLVRLVGNITITGNNIRGSIEVGVAPGRLRSIDGAEQRIFTRDENGYKWAVPAMTISGTLDNITEDLSTRIKDAWLDENIGKVIDTLTGVPTKPGEAIQTGTKLFQEATKLAPKILEVAPDAVKQGVDLFQGLLPR